MCAHTSALDCLALIRSAVEPNADSLCVCAGRAFRRARRSYVRTMCESNRFSMNFRDFLNSPDTAKTAVLCLFIRERSKAATPAHNSKKRIQKKIEQSLEPVANEAAVELRLIRLNTRIRELIALVSVRSLKDISARCRAPQRLWFATNH